MKVQLTVEKTTSGSVYGHVTVNDNLIVDEAETVEALKDSLKKLAFDSEGVQVTEFEIVTDKTI